VPVTAACAVSVSFRSSVSAFPSSLTWRLPTVKPRHLRMLAGSMQCVQEVYFSRSAKNERLLYPHLSCQGRKEAEQVPALVRPLSMQCQTAYTNKVSPQLPIFHRQLLSTLHVRRQLLLGSRQRVCQAPRGLLDNLFGNQGSSELHPDRPVFAPIDTESDGGLGGTSEGLFGPLVPLHFHAEVTSRPAESNLKY
jgi:hypothetical protein